MRGHYSVIPEKRLLEKALPETDLKYRSSLRAVTSSATATWQRRTAGKDLLVGNDMPLLMRRNSTPKIVRRADIDVAIL